MEIKLKPAFYLFESKYPKRTHYTSGFKKLLKDLKVDCDLRLSCTRDAYDDSDNTAWILLFGKNRQELDRVRDLLLKVEYRKQKVFSVSGNGYGTGLSVMLNYNKEYK